MKKQKRKKRIKSRNPTATVLIDPMFHQRVVTKTGPKDVKPEIKEEWE